MYEKYLILCFTLLMILTSCTNNDLSLSTQQDQPKLEAIQTNKVTDKDLTVHYIDAGQADATLFQFYDEDKLVNILYDTGDWKRTDVIDYLINENIDTLDLVIISHPHADHIGQLAEMIDLFTIEEIWMSGNETPTLIFKKAIETLLEAGIAYDEPRQGMIYDIGPLTLSMIHPETLTSGLNEDSLAIKFTYGEVDFLFTGDAYSEQEKMMIESDIDITADILQLGHHGSSTSSSNEFIEQVNPDIAIYSAGKNNIYNHPSKDVLARLKDKNIDVYGTDSSGSIVISTDGKTYNLKTNNEQTAHNNCINLNEATHRDLMKIVHIGDLRAKEIIDMRPITHLNELKAINGINEKRLNEIIDEDLACIGGD